MQPSMILWTHALAALLFGMVALAQARRRGGGLPRVAFVAGLAATALWALAVAGIDSRDVATRIAEGGRNLAWLGFMFALTRQERRDPGVGWLATIYLAASAIVMIAVGLAIAEVLVGDVAQQAFIGDARLGMRVLSGITALFLAYHLQASATPGARGGVRLATAALAAMIASDLAINLTAWIGGAWPTGLVAARGALLVVLAPLFAIAVQRDGNWTLRISRSIAFQSLSVLVIGGYVLLAGIATSYLGSIAGTQARALQTAFVFGTTTALVTILSTPWLRAWAKVLIAKHLFSHRYDYRHEWLRFTETLGAPGEGAAPLAKRVVKSIADLTDSPAGLLLVARDGTLEHAAEWNWAGDTPAADNAALCRHLAATHRIIELDAVRAETADPADARAAPAWLLARDDAWAIVPLLHFATLAGAIVLARPAIDRALDWEDFDLLGVAGRQVASYLAEDRAHDALADAQRFDEFNRRFAFIMHDLKNLVSQLTLVARNAERHADNPDFRADMIATLKESSDRMNVLLARLSQHRAGRGEPLRAVPLRALAKRIATGRRMQHPVIVSDGPALFALADPSALETLIVHLVQNAVEASAPDDAVTLDIVEPATPGHVAIEIADHGCGMSPAFVRDQLFKPFASSKPGGFGLGAFEARQLAEHMGGTVTVESREGEGTRFRVTLPAAQAMETAA